MRQPRAIDTNQGEARGSERSACDKIGGKGRILSTLLAPDSASNIAQSFTPFIARFIDAVSGKLAAVWLLEIDITMTISKVCSHHHLEEYIGTAEALIAAGLVRRRQLPGAPGMPRLAATFYDGELVRRGARPPKDERYVRVHRLRGGWFLVARGLSADQREQRAAKAHAMVELERAKRSAAQALRMVPSSARDYRDSCVLELKGRLAFLRVAHLSSNEFGAQLRGGFKFDDETLAAFDKIAADLLSVLRNGRVCFDRDKQSEIVVGIKNRVAKADLALQELLAGAIASVAIHGAGEKRRG